MRQERTKLRMLIQLIIGMMLISGNAIGWGQVRESWARRYDGGTFYATNAALHGQSLYVTGHAFGYTTIKYHVVTGEELWVGHYEYRPLSGIPKAIVVDSVGNVIVTGSSPNLQTGAAYATVKYDGQTGQELWSARYNGSTNGNDQANAIAVDSHDDIYVTGGSFYGGTGQDFTTIKYHGQTGQELWAARYNGSRNGNDQAFAITVDAQSNVYVTGSSFGTGTGTDFITIKYDGQTGQQLWISRYHQTVNDTARAIALDSQGNVMVAGDVGAGYTTIKYEAQTGLPLWADFVPLAGSGVFAPVVVSVAIDYRDDLFVIGTFDQTGSVRQSKLIKYNGQTGQKLWEQVFPSGFQSLSLDEDGDAYVCGAGFGPFGNDYDFRVAKFNGRTGHLLWTQTRSGMAHAIVVDSEGGVYVTGYTGPPSFFISYLTIKYEQSPPGDVDYDFCVDEVDLLRILDTFGQGGDLPEDVNRDGAVDDKDLLTVLFNFGRGCGGE